MKKTLLLATALILGNTIFSQVFTKVQTGFPVNDNRSSYGCGWGDFDNNGYQDLMVTTAYTESDLLYLNNGGGFFDTINVSGITTDAATTRAVNWGDYDNDGDLDLFVSHQTQSNSLYRNEGNNTFTKIINGAIVSDGGESLASAWGDYDNDGFLDLFVANFSSQNDFLYHNNGDGTFTKITTGPIVTDGASSAGCAWADYDNDGFLDLYVAVWGNDLLYHNNGDGTFTKITTGPIVTDAVNTNGGSWGDYDNDGDIDLFATGSSTQCSMYQNDGTGTFTKVTGPWSSDPSRIYTGSDFGDFDNDGDLDLFVANSSNGGAGVSNFLYLNNGNGTFFKISEAVTADVSDSRAATWIDYDNDGALDLFVANEVSDNDYLYHNNGNANTWININLKGITSNRSAIGAKVRLCANVSGQPVWQMREVLSQTGNQAQGSLCLEFGLNSANKIDTLIIEWPSGIVCKLYNMDVNKFVTINENCEYYANSVIKGMVYEDSNSNCANDSAENGLANRLLKLLPLNFYATTDTMGNYEFSVPPGNYQIVSLPNKYWIQTCPTSGNYLSVNVVDSTGQEYVGNNIGQEIDKYCTELAVDISTSVVRRCFNTNYFVQYKNVGTLVAYDAKLEVEFDSDLSPQSSTLPWDSISGNKVYFSLDTVLPGQIAKFYITTYVSCNALWNQTKCVTAHIFPDSLCLGSVDTTWDKSSIKIYGHCQNDSLACFIIKNMGKSGEGDMDGTSQYRIYADNVLMGTQTFQLAGGDTLEVCVVTGNQTIRLEADQRPGHPGKSKPKLSIEGCGDSTQVFSWGQITMVPEDDEDGFVETECREVTGSYDPNDKSVKPKGVTMNNYVDSTAVLDYHINFQNTGNDTAFTVVVRDTLSNYLDITSLEMGASSHTYTYKISGKNVLTVYFNNILLADSNTNEPASHGFFKFKIHQIKNNAYGTVIENTAGIYFDFNDPVITNTTMNTIGVSYIPLSITNKSLDGSVLAEVFPNPHTDYVYFQFSDNKTKKIDIYDLKGRLIYSLSGCKENMLKWNSGSVETGVYIYNIVDENNNIQTGRLIKTSGIK